MTLSMATSRFAWLVRSRWRWVSPLLLIVAASRPVAAHEIGTTRVSVVLEQNGRYRAEIVTDATSLVEKLEVSSGRVPTANATPTELTRRLTEDDERFRRRVSLAFDRVDGRPAVAYAVAPPTATIGAMATIVLTGDVPPGAQALTWKYGWTFAAYSLSVRAADSQEMVTEWIEGGDVSRPIALGVPATPTRPLVTIARYLALGFTHILPKGFDHVLFVLGLFLLTRRSRPLLLQVSAFTVAHSITLALGLYHVVTVPPAIVEPLIALSIAYVAIENLFLSDLRAWRIALVFAFGLLHGMGFAGALGELGLPRSEFLTALVGFNLGVEAGQLTVIAAAFLLVGGRWEHYAWYRRLIVVPASAAIACVAVYWTIARLISA
jgi:hypothetical protein